MHPQPSPSASQKGQICAGLVGGCIAVRKWQTGIQNNIYRFPPLSGFQVFHAKVNLAELGLEA